MLAASFLPLLAARLSAQISETREVSVTLRGAALEIVLHSPTAELTLVMKREVLQHGQSSPLAVPQLGSCAFSERAWRLWADLDSQKEAGPLGAQPSPRVLELATSKVADFTAFDHAGPLHTRCRRPHSRSAILRTS